MEGHPSVIPEVSVVVPYHPARARNGMLARALTSINKQTVPHHLITVEDTEKQGAAATRQRGLDEATTPWVAFLDSDDEMDPTHLEQLLACARETGADYAYPWFRVRGGRDPFPMFFGRPWDDDHPHATTITILVRTGLAKLVGFHGQGEDFAFTKGCVTAGAHIVHLPVRSWTWHHHGANSSGLPTRGDARAR
ncbi:glycosyltransferase [Streptomyces sp. 549]|uniref:glycosyltransferase family 2 protein n=1 Tax=Streptomyces sp. 549 TaxID=3049076 RepID=UPI0024C244BD|nr:glycosyltransferase [Streptomyces sp. 549]MDK1473600.1 glycosyltransferase [Streptomyces sp. 549]